jgi:hypothetical protein
MAKSWTSNTRTFKTAYSSEKQTNCIRSLRADYGSWSRIDTKEQVKAILINRNIEKFSHAGDTPFGYTPLGDELGHTGDTLMANDICNGTLEHRSLTDHAIKAITKQLRKHPLLTKMISPVVMTEDFISCFGCVAEKTSSSPSDRHVGHYLACIDLHDELSVLLASVHAAMMSIPLANLHKKHQVSLANINTDDLTKRVSLPF